MILKSNQKCNSKQAQELLVVFFVLDNESVESLIVVLHARDSRWA